MVFLRYFQQYLVATVVLFNLTLHGQSSTLVITHSFNRPDFIEIQKETLKKFMKSPYEFVVFNDAKTAELYDAIETTCDCLGIRSISIPQSIHKSPSDPCVSCADVIQYSLDMLAFDHNGYVMILDADMFLLQPFDVNEYMKETLIAGHPQIRGHVEYIWNGIFIIDMEYLPSKRDLNFASGVVEGHPCDVGGFTYYYFKEHPEVQVKSMTPHYYLDNHAEKDPTRSCDTEGFTYYYFNEYPEVQLRYTGTYSDVEHHAQGDLKQIPPMIQYTLERGGSNCEFFVNDTFFHYRSGGNWDRKSQAYHDKKTRILHELIEFVLNQ